MHETRGFGNMGFMYKMSEPVPYVSFNRMAERGRGANQVLRTVLQDSKKSIRIF